MDEEMKKLGPSMTFIPECLGHPAPPFRPWPGCGSVRSIMRPHCFPSFPLLLSIPGNLHRIV